MTTEELIKDLQGSTDFYAHQYPTETAELCAAAAAELRRLSALVSRLPLTADGVRVVPGEDMLYTMKDGQVYHSRKWKREGGQWWLVFKIAKGIWSERNLSRCFSTPESARAGK